MAKNSLISTLSMVPFSNPGENASKPCELLIGKTALLNLWENLQLTTQSNTCFFKLCFCYFLALKSTFASCHWKIEISALVVGMIESYHLKNKTEVFEDHKLTVKCHFQHYSLFEQFYMYSWYAENRINQNPLLCKMQFFYLYWLSKKVVKENGSTIMTQILLIFPFTFKVCAPRWVPPSLVLASRVNFSRSQDKILFPNVKFN